MAVKVVISIFRRCRCPISVSRAIHSVFKSAQNTVTEHSRGVKFLQPLIIERPF